MAPRNKGQAHKVGKQLRDAQRLQAFKASKQVLQPIENTQWRLVPVDVPPKLTLRVGANVIHTPDEYDAAIAETQAKIRELRRQKNQGAASIQSAPTLSPTSLPVSPPPPSTPKIPPTIAEMDALSGDEVHRAVEAILEEMAPPHIAFLTNDFEKVYEEARAELTAENTKSTRLLNSPSG